MSEIAATINEFRSRHLSELTEVNYTCTTCLSFWNVVRGFIVQILSDILCCPRDFVLQLCETSGSSLGYGFSRVVNKGKVQPPDSSDENQVSEGTLAI